MCLSLKQLEWAEVRRRILGEKEATTKKFQKFPSRERNFAVRRKKTNNNNTRFHEHCEDCARIAERENR